MDALFHIGLQNACWALALARAAALGARVWRHRPAVAHTLWLLVLLKLLTPSLVGVSLQQLSRRTTEPRATNEPRVTEDQTPQPPFGHHLTGDERAQTSALAARVDGRAGAARRRRSLS